MVSRQNRRQPQIECKIKGNFRLKGIRSTNPIAVGDRVQISINAEGTAFITEIEDRKNYIIRRASNLSKQSHIIAANLNQCMLIVTVNYPKHQLRSSTVFWHQQKLIVYLSVLYSTKSTGIRMRNFIIWKH